ncbi:hypothetical protein EK21DRAFT_118541 [Setomelanomma holmii]|uniref:Uncharacterized protein n=1 Tax=Setomelanomma holmii TaxID=210430 RepID=A0A9P4LFY5_9PLEO|nr:hypothetical protein EK21DRAFT_118541 [Setomelanomma holmii]
MLDNHMVETLNQQLPRSMAADEEHNVTVHKGEKLLQMMLSDDETAGHVLNPAEEDVKSKFTDMVELNDHGFIGEVNEDCITVTGIEHLSPALHALGLSANMVCDGGKNVMITHTHSEERTNGEVVYAPTQAAHIQICNPSEGVMIVSSDHSASFMGAHQDPPVATVPPLHHWSDIAYFAMARYVYLSRTHVVLSSTDQNSKTYVPWPGVTFDIDSEESKAILGTPNGAGTVWLLIQRKKDFGDRRIEKVTLFYAEKEDDAFRWPSLLFWIV